MNLVAFWAALSASAAVAYKDSYRTTFPEGDDQLHLQPAHHALAPNMLVTGKDGELFYVPVTVLSVESGLATLGWPQHVWQYKGKRANYTVRRHANWDEEVQEAVVRTLVGGDYDPGDYKFRYVITRDGGDGGGGWPDAATLYIRDCANGAFLMKTDQGRAFYAHMPGIEAASGISVVMGNESYEAIEISKEQFNNSDGMPYQPGEGGFEALGEWRAGFRGRALGEMAIDVPSWEPRDLLTVVTFATFLKRSGSRELPFPGTACGVREKFDKVTEAAL